MRFPPFVRSRRHQYLIGSLIIGGLLAAGLMLWMFFGLVNTRDHEILLGMSGPLNGPSKELGREMEIGINTYLKHINDEGGVHGRKLKLIALDDEYEPDKALANMIELNEKRKVFAVIGNVGTPTALLTVDYAVRNKLIFFGAFSGANVLRRDPPDRYVFNYRASYEEETAKIVEYLVERKKIPPEAIAVFDQKDAFGDAGFGGVVKVMRKYKRESWDIVRVRYERNTIHVKDAVDHILQKPEIKAVVMVGTYRPITEFIRQIKAAKRDDIIFTNVSFVGSEALAQGLKEHGFADGVIVTQVVPPIDSNASIVLKYHELRNRYFPNEHPSFTSLEGYISTALFVEGLKRAGANPTSENMIQALETIHEFDLGTGTPLTFTASEHQASHKVWATVLDKAGNFKVLDMTE